MNTDHPICRTADGRKAAAVLFRRYAPPPELSALVESLWTFEASADGTPLTDCIIPDVATEIICRMDGEPRTFFRGPRLHMEEITIEARARYAGARLWPGIGPGLFRMSAREACGARWALDDLSCPVDAPPQAFTTVLGELFGRRGHEDHGRIASRAARLIAALHGRMSVADVASAMGCSIRHLHREMMSGLGMGPKTVSRIARARRAAAQLRAADAGLAAVAVDSGYADQAHMTRDFSALGMPSPACLRQWRESDFVNTAGHGRS